MTRLLCDIMDVQYYSILCELFGSQYFIQGNVEGDGMVHSTWKLHYISVLFCHEIPS